jgi:hypothetical protein
VKVTVDGRSYLPDATGGFLKQGIEFKDYYGKTVNVSIEDAGSRKDYSFYVPKQATAKKLGQPQSNHINRTGNTLEWTPDANSTTGKLVLYYTLYKEGTTAAYDDAVIYKQEAVLLDDNGQYSLDNILADTAITKINFILTTGNAVAFQTKDGKKLTFDIKSCDSHEYNMNK